MKYLEKTLFSKVKENILRGRKKDALLKEEYTNSKIKTLIMILNTILMRDPNLLFDFVETVS